MIKTDPSMLVYDATPGPWESVIGATNGGGRLIIESHDFGAIVATSKRGAPSTQSRLSPDSPYYRSQIKQLQPRMSISVHLAPLCRSRISELAVIESNARLICAAPPLLKVAQKLLLWMEECMAACDFNQDDIDLYHELRQTIRTAGGFSSETHWWQGPCICDACGHAWQGVVEIPVEATGPQVPLECGECHQMTGGPA